MRCGWYVCHHDLYGRIAVGSWLVAKDASTTHLFVFFPAGQFCNYYGFLAQCIFSYYKWEYSFFSDLGLIFKRNPFSICRSKLDQPGKYLQTPLVCPGVLAITLALQKIRWRWISLINLPVQIPFFQGHAVWHLVSWSVIHVVFYTFGSEEKRDPVSKIVYSRQ